MRTELPVCKRCCFCVPLRYGLITWGYFKLTISSIVSIVLTFTLYDTVDRMIRYGNSYYAHDIGIISAVLVALLTDIALTTVFIVGGHTKNVKLLRVYYIYNIVILCLTSALVLGLLVITLVIMGPRIPDRLFSWATWLMLLDFSTSFVNIIMQVYFLLLLRSEIIKLRNNCEFRFVNNAAEAECVMKYKEGMVDEETGSKDICEEGPCGTEATCHKNKDQN